MRTKATVQGQATLKEKEEVESMERERTWNGWKKTRMMKGEERLLQEGKQGSS